MPNYNILKAKILNAAVNFGFLDAKIASYILNNEAKQRFTDFIKSNYHGSMAYLANNMELRFNPQLLVPDTLSIIMVKLPYLTTSVKEHFSRLNSTEGYISIYALGRDYHKVLKSQLKKYAEWINDLLQEYNLSHKYRVFTDSAPIMEVELGSSHGLGWRGKNTLLLNREGGSFFFLGEIFTNLNLEPDAPITSHCGSCTKCLQVCPTNAFIKPYLLDAGRCISYLTIENKGPIPIEFRHAIGNRIYGCDDCQLVCPWNKFAKLSTIPDFKPKSFTQKSLIQLFTCTEVEFLKDFAGSPIYRIGYRCFIRNLSIAMGNANYSLEIINALNDKLILFTQDEMLTEHINWAIQEQNRKKV